MKTILIPTDFNPKSTQILDSLIQEETQERFRIIFLHAFKISDSITDMLMLSRRSRDYELVNDDFYQMLNFYRAKYARQLDYIGIEYFYGSTVVAFRNFLEAFEVDGIAYPKNYAFNPINKYSLDPKFLTQRAGCPILEVEIEESTLPENLMDSKIPEQQTLAKLKA